MVFVICQRKRGVCVTTFPSFPLFFGLRSLVFMSLVFMSLDAFTCYSSVLIYCLHHQEVQGRSPKYFFRHTKSKVYEYRSRDNCLYVIPSSFIVSCISCTLFFFHKINFSLLSTKSTSVNLQVTQSD